MSCFVANTLMDKIAKWENLFLVMQQSNTGQIKAPNPALPIDLPHVHYKDIIQSDIL